MNSHTIYAMMTALVALILAATLAGCGRVEAFQEEDDVIGPGTRLLAEKLPREEETESGGGNKKGDRAQPEDARRHADEPPPAAEHPPKHDAEHPPKRAAEHPPKRAAEHSPPPPPADKLVEPFVGGMMARF